ncbi:hypothetical protein Syun_026020 [Stephania yunnanensis]|uniref:Cyanobacterial aminoacyl-tRNA synthetase CAAD domain-containing protein n=1 Tax=Stephania yunnanensis TaxID=152371 RepID=A0AAP0EVE3_9MAGN
MASISAALLSPSLIFHGRKTLLGTLPKLPVSAIKESQRHLFVARATGENSETSSSIVKSVQSAWEKSEDQIAVVGLGFAAIVAFWASSNLVAAIDKLPLVPTGLELIGLLYSSWFIYRYLLFKPDREELFQNIKKYVSDVLDQ